MNASDNGCVLLLKVRDVDLLESMGLGTLCKSSCCCGIRLGCFQDDG